MLKKEIYNKNRVLSPFYTSTMSYENDIFDLLRIDPNHFEECVRNHKTYALLLRNWIKECSEQNTPTNKVAKNIVQSGVLYYMGLTPTLKFRT
ncbi:hypothetical protein [Aquimarina algiphila]|uniref:Uncharacterized protein n=1 Tax=Aquimarina algiphila TaxID=2047982 RepID=A0A554VRK5_9FLAO|nr:hypothetical protein [Aquimarina algiphila]TSE11282.1 hypothetical protein FOF46_01240 [Aquimarina algiphila]